MFNYFPKILIMYVISLIAYKTCCRNTVVEYQMNWINTLWYQYCDGLKLFLKKHFYHLMHLCFHNKALSYCKRSLADKHPIWNMGLSLDEFECLEVAYDAVFQSLEIKYNNRARLYCDFTILDNSPFWSALDPWEVEFEKSSWTN